MPITTTPVKTDSPEILHAIDVIKETYGDTVSVQDKKKDLLKFGRNELVGTSTATVMTLPAGEVHETYVASNLINSIISDAADTVDVIVEGHTISGGNFTFVTQTATLTGTTVVALGTALARVSRVYNNNSTDLVGSVYVTETDTYTAGVPDTATKVHLTVSAGHNQSEKAATTLSSVDYWLLTSVFGDILEKTASFVNVELEVRLSGKVFRHKVNLGVSNSHSHHPFNPLLIVPKNADVRLVASADGANTDVSGGMQGYLASVV